MRLINVNMVFLSIICDKNVSKPFKHKISQIFCLRRDSGRDDTGRERGRGRDDMQWTRTRTRCQISSRPNPCFV